MSGHLLAKSKKTFFGVSNMKTIQLQKASPPPIKQRPDTRSVRYRLISVTSEQGTRYQISVRFQNESASALLPFSEREEAVCAYRMIKNGLVTPTTLHEVIEDIK